jgi:putative FmdB family regulatory protein
MPMYDYECPACGSVFEVIVFRGSDPPPSCPRCGRGQTRRLMAAPAVHIKADCATTRIEKRVKDYLTDGKISDATRFADKAASMVKSDRVKRIADKLHKKTGQ